MGATKRQLVWQGMVLYLLPILFISIGCQKKEASNDSIPSSMSSFPPDVEIGNLATLPPGVKDFFKTPFVDESQYIVYSVALDLANIAEYTNNGKFPDRKEITLAVDELEGTEHWKPLYGVRVQTPSISDPIVYKVRVDKPIWDPELYMPMAELLIKPESHDSPESFNIQLINDFLEGDIEPYREQNIQLTKRLNKNFWDSEAHLQAALLLEVFAFSDHAFNFYDLRASMHRITSHLCLARLINPDIVNAPEFKFARAFQETLMGNQANALEYLDSVENHLTGLTEWTRILRMHNTLDYRIVKETSTPTYLEKLEYFYVLARNFGALEACQRNYYEDIEGEIEWVRIVVENDYSVGIGHYIAPQLIPVELDDIADHCLAFKNKELSEKNAASLLNFYPEDSCYDAESTELAVLGWGLYANYLQRNLCNAIFETHGFYEHKLGDHDAAKQVSIQIQKSFKGLLYDPLIKLRLSNNKSEYQKAMRDAYAYVQSYPDRTPTLAWHTLSYARKFSELYTPYAHPHINEWHKHNPPPGTVYNMEPRYYQPSLTWRDDKESLFAQLNKRAPFDYKIIRHYFDYRSNDPSYGEALKLVEPILDYNPAAKYDLAQSMLDSPEKYEVLMLEAAEQLPLHYVEMARYFYDREDCEKAAHYIDLAIDANTDAVQVSHAIWIGVECYLDLNQPKKAARIADFGEQVYSYAGLMAKGTYLDRTNQTEAAMGIYKKIKERYSDSDPMLQYALKCSFNTTNNPYKETLESVTTRTFPQGIQSSPPPSSHDPAPRYGVIVTGENAETEKVGLHKGDVIVWINGYPVENLDQYAFVRSVLPEKKNMELVIWNGKTFEPISANPPDKKFGVEFKDYRP